MIGTNVVNLVGTPPYSGAKPKKEENRFEKKTHFTVVNKKRELNNIVGYKGVQLVTISRPTAYGEYAPYHFVDTEQEFKPLVIGLRP